jgi:hypothetical protein
MTTRPLWFAVITSAAAFAGQACVAEEETGQGVGLDEVDAPEADTEWRRRGSSGASTSTTGGSTTGGGTTVDTCALCDHAAECCEAVNPDTPLCNMSEAACESVAEASRPHYIRFCRTVITTIFYAWDGNPPAACF